MDEQTPSFRFLATGIGSVPFLDIGGACIEILKLFPSAPFWPQFVKRSYLEDMSVQYTEGLPLLDVHEGKRSISVSRTKQAESELTRFYEHFLAQDMDFFAISRDRAPGLYTLLDIMERDNVSSGPFIKGQTVGPITFATGILDLNGKPLLHNPELLEAMVNGLAIKALWQIRALAGTGRRPIIFLDEPCLSGVGSAFSAIERHEVIRILRTIMQYLREHSDVLIGIHCCGNTDWPMIIEAGPDIINFDAFDYLSHFLLYPKEIMDFVNTGGSIAWGIVPSAGFSGRETVEGLYSKLEEGLQCISKWGVHAERLIDRSLLTPACGMGTMTPETAKTSMNLLFELSKACNTLVGR
jgi:hypothetical protein